MSNSTLTVKTPHRFVASLLAFVFLTTTLVFLVPPTTAQADGVLSLNATTSSSILAGESTTLNMTATNISPGTDLYNLSFSHELPVGVTYVPGSTDPSTVGNPRIITVVTIPDPLFPLVTVENQVLIWENVSDLIAGSTSGLSFDVQADPVLYPVGSTFDKTSNAYANTDPRYIPDFDSVTGEVVPGVTSYTNFDTVTPQITQVAAIDINKSNPNPESELMRGVHDQTSTFTINVRNTDQADTENVVIVDYIPAGLEFLGCGAVDNSAAPEYTGAPSLTNTPVPANCIDPDSVTTVLNPAGYPAGVYTRVEWNIGTLTAIAPTNTRTITYAVGVPLFENTMTFPLGTPSGASLDQIANLDNNTGASTRHINEANSYRNAVTATGDYTGPVAPLTSSIVTSGDTNTISVTDLSVVTTTSDANFVAGDQFTYNMMVRTGEYASASAITLTDTLPDGICPLVPAGTTIIGTMPADCTAVGTVTGATINSVTVNGDGTFTIDFAIIPSTLDPNTTVNIVYTALFRANYAGSTDPTASGDSFATGTDISGTTTPVPATGVIPDEIAVDDSGTSHASERPTIEKLVLPRANVTSAADCINFFGQYVPDASAVIGSQFVQGDRICFQLTVNFSSTTDTRNAQITDFVPVGTEYEGYVVGTATEGSTLPAAQVSVPTDPDIPTWRLGEVIGGNPTDLFVTRGSTLVLFVSALVTEPSPTTEVDITANLMKYSQENTAGQVYALRAQADFGIAPAPEISLRKSISNVNGTANSLPYPDTANIVGGQYVDFAIGLNNLGNAVDGNDQPITEYTVWDALPAPITCADVSAVDNGGVCTDNFAGVAGGAYDGQSVITWTVTTPLQPSVPQTFLNYRVTFPNSGLTPDTDYANLASVTQFEIGSSAGGSTTFYPENSLDLSLQPLWNVTDAVDDAIVTTPAVTVAKSLTSPVVAPINTASNAVAGELVDYTYSVTIPPRTTIYNGVLNDTLPTGLTNLPSTTNSTTIPNGVTTYSALTGYSTAFDATYTNNTDSPQTFSTTLIGVQVTPSFTGANITNTVTFRSNVSLGGPALSNVSTTANLPVIRPRPTISKTVSPTSVSAGQTVTFTLTANNTTGNPAGYDTILIDCLPNGITFLADVTLPVGITRDAPTPGTGTGAGQNGCATTTHLIQYNLGTIQPNTPIVIQFSGTVDPSAGGLQAYANTARVVTSTLSNGVRDNTVEGVFNSTTATATATVVGTSLSKTTTAPTAPVGGTVPYTLSVNIPASVNFYNAAIIDNVPAGILLDQSSSVVTCTVAVTLADCSADLPSGGSTMTPTSTQAGWYLGTITSSPSVRTITITVNSTVRDIPGNVIGGTITNTARLSWMNAAGAPPANAGSTFDRNTTINAGSTAVTTVQEPSLSITKTNNDSTPAPGADFDYEVRVTNANNANTSTAHNVTVTDTVPTGVVVDAGTISNGGVLTGATANGGGVITWTGLTIARNATTSLTYTATLADSTTLTAAALTNTARVTTYSSLSSGGRLYTTPVPTATSNVTPQFPAVTLNKAAVDGTIAYENQPFAWRLTMTNAASAAEGTTIVATDVLPENWTYVADSAQYNNGGAGGPLEPTISTVGDVQTLVWNLPSAIEPGMTITITYEATPSSDALVTPGIGTGTPHTNTFSAVTTDATGATTNATASYTAPAVTANAFIASADLSVTKTAVGTLVAGETTANAWTVVVRNLAGSDTAVGAFTVTDTITSLPAGVTIGQPTGTGWSCTVPTVDGNFTCQRTNANDTLAGGATFPTITIPATVAFDVAEGTEIENNVNVFALTTDPNPANNFDDAIQTVTVETDLAVVKTTSGVIEAGGTATWQVVVENNGSSIATSPTTVTETLPAGVTNAVATGTGWDCAAPVSGVITCEYNTDFIGFAPGITVTADVDSDVTGNMVNNVEVTGTNPDPDLDNNTDSTSDPVDTDTSLLIEKSLTGDEVVAGGTTTYQVDVSNSGRADARNVVVTDPLPNGLTFAGNVTSIAGDWDCTEVSASPSTVECVLNGTLPASGSDTASVSFDVDIPSSLPLGTIVDNVATASADNADDVSDNALGTPVGVSDLSIDKLIWDSPVTAGQTAIYDIYVTNNGETDNNGRITVVDTLPEGFTLASAEGVDWTCDVTVGATSVTCYWDSGLVDGEGTDAITVVANIDPSVPASTLYNTAVVSGTSDYTDSNLSNNSDDAETVVVTDAALTIVKTGEAILVPGESTTYTVTVTNTGVSNAANVELVDVLPAGVTAVSIVGSGWTCDDETLTCTIASLPIGDTEFTIVADVASSVADGTTLTNNVSVEWNDSSGRDSAADDFSGVTEASADVVLVKTATEPTATAGTITAFEFVVTNEGSSDAVADITITDTLPAGMMFVSATSAGSVWACAPDSIDPQVVDCVLESGIVAGGTAPLLTIEVQLDESLPAETLTNTATALSPTDDPNLDNNTDSTDVTVAQEVDIAVTEELLDGTVRIGNTLRFGYFGINNGPSTALDVSMRIVVPFGLNEVDMTGSDPDWTCTVGTPDENGTEVICELASALLSGEETPTLVLSAVVAAESFPEFTNDVTISTSTPETTLENNVDGLALSVPPLVGLNITKNNNGVVQAGERAHYIITVTNRGLTVAPNGFTVIDTLPASLSYVSSEGEGVTCTVDGNIVTCVFTEPLAIDETAQVDIFVDVARDATGAIVNTAVVSTDDENLSDSVVLAENEVSVAAANPDNLPNTGAVIAFWLLIGSVLSMLVGGVVMLLANRKKGAITTA